MHTKAVWIHAKKRQDSLQALSFPFRHKLLVVIVVIAVCAVFAILLVVVRIAVVCAVRTL